MYIYIYKLKIITVSFVVIKKKKNIKSEYPSIFLLNILIGTDARWQENYEKSTNVSIVRKLYSMSILK